MTTTIFQINNDAPPPAGLISVDRFLLQAPGAVRLDPAYANVSGSTITAFRDAVTNATYTGSDPFVTRETINGIQVANFAVPGASGTSQQAAAFLDPALCGVGRFSQVAVFKPATMTLSGDQQFIMGASIDAAGTPTTAALRVSTAAATFQALARRSVADAAVVTPALDLVTEDGWRAVAVSYDYTGNKVEVYDLLTDTPAQVTAIGGTPGAAPTAPTWYYVGVRRTPTGVASSVPLRFRGLLSDGFHLPYALGTADVGALRAQAQERVRQITA
jgi:hypothetical protein